MEAWFLMSGFPEAGSPEIKHKETGQTATEGALEKAQTTVTEAKAANQQLQQENKKEIRDAPPPWLLLELTFGLPCCVRLWNPTRCPPSLASRMLKPSALAA